jgi:hypothetical protein
MKPNKLSPVVLALSLAANNCGGKVEYYNDNINAVDSGADSEAEDAQQEVKLDAKQDAKQDAPQDSQQDIQQVEADTTEKCKNILLQPSVKYPINQMVIKGDTPFAIGCWDVVNPCDAPLDVKEVTFDMTGIANLDIFSGYYIPKTADKPILNTKDRTVTFPIVQPWQIPSKEKQSFCLAADVSPTAQCGMTADFGIDQSGLKLEYQGQPVTKDSFQQNFPVMGGTNMVSCLNLFDSAFDSQMYTEFAVGNILQCMDVEIHNTGSKDLILKNFTAAVEFSGDTSVKGGLLDTTDPANPQANVGPMQIVDENENHIQSWVGTPEVSVTGTDNNLEYQNLNPDILLHSQNTHRLSLVVDVLNVQELVGQKIRCVFRKNPEVTYLDGKPVNPVVVGPGEDIYGNWITLTK